jgi:hypothetical protein
MCPGTGGGLNGAMVLDEDVNAFQLIELQGGHESSFAIHNHRSRWRNLRPELRWAAGRKCGMRIDLAPFGKKILPMVRSGFGRVPPP